MGMIDNVSHFVYVVSSPIFSTIFVVLNVLTIIIFIRKFRLASLSLVIMMNICLCDIVVCLLSNNFYVINLIHPTYNWATGSLSCKLFKTLTMMCNLSQIFSFVVLCWDRMRRLVFSTDPQWKKKHGIIFMFLIWILSVSLTAGRFVLFDERVIVRHFNGTNGTTTKIVNFACKPIGLNTVSYAIMTIVQFVVGYMIPMIFILVTIGICEFNIHKNMHLISKKIGNSYSLRMNRQLSNVFNTTALLFMIIWTPFFIMSVLDLNTNLLGNKELTHLNFAFRCTLLVAGSGKPLIYMIALQRFRAAMCGSLCTHARDSISEDTVSTNDSRGRSKRNHTTSTNQSRDEDSCEKSDGVMDREFSNISRGEEVD